MTQRFTEGEKEAYIQGRDDGWFVALKMVEIEMKRIRKNADAYTNEFESIRGFVDTKLAEIRKHKEIKSP